MTTWDVIEGDCLTVLQTLAAESVDAMVADPPAGIGFMGKEWDSFAGGRGSGFKAKYDRPGTPSYFTGQARTTSVGTTRAERDAFIAFLTAVMSECYRVLLAGFAEVVGGQALGQADGTRMGRTAEEGANTRRSSARNHHPTVKPVALMQWLCRLVTPPGGTVLDPFTGSGTTGMAALREGFGFLGIEREADYAAIARARIEGDAPLFNARPE